MIAYYNEFDSFAANWLRNLMDVDLLPRGAVDERSIREVKAEDVREATQAHFFAGIGGWPYALRLAGWPDDRPVWTGSCPCQPFSASGRNKGTEDSRDLWPVFLRLIADCRPATIFGEQSPRAIAFGWLDRLCDDLEELNYAVGSAVLPACSVGAAHERSRLWWVANSQHGRLEIGRRAATVSSTVRDSNGVSVFSASSLPVQIGAMVDKGKIADQENWEGRPKHLSVANGVPGVMGRSRAYGNAIRPQLAAVFVRAFMEAEL